MSSHSPELRRLLKLTEVVIRLSKMTPDQLAEVVRRIERYPWPRQAPPERTPARGPVGLPAITKL
jgi:hypothetical protein